MNKTNVSSEKLQEIRRLLPWGAQTEIAKRLSTKENKVTPQDVNRSLHGRKLRHGEVAARDIIMAALEIITDQQAENARVNKAVDDVIIAAKKK